MDENGFDYTPSLKSSGGHLVGLSNKDEILTFLDAPWN
jgi:hypothetical protein